MATHTTHFLYGDSTESKLSTNFLEFLRDAIQFSVTALQVDTRIDELRVRREGLRESARQETAELVAFVQTVTSAIDQGKGNATGKPTLNCAAHLLAASNDAQKNFQTQLNGKLATAIQAVDAEERAQRDACMAALGRFLAAHEPVQDAATCSLTANEAGGYSGSFAGATTRGSFAGATQLNVSWTFSVAVPEGHLWATPVRVGAVMPALEIQVPQVSGWLSKVKLGPKRIDALVVTAFAFTRNGVRKLSLREPGTEVGFDLEVEANGSAVRMTRLAPVGDATGGEVEVQAEDMPKLVELADKLRDSLENIRGGELKVATWRDASFDAIPVFRTYLDLLVAFMAPITRTIAERSVLPTELVIRKLLSNDRREDIFVMKAALREKYAVLPVEQRSLFGPLGFDSAPTTAPAAMSAPPVEAAPVEAAPVAPVAVVPAVTAPPVEVVEVVDAGPETPRAATAAVAVTPLTAVAKATPSTAPVLVVSPATTAKTTNSVLPFASVTPGKPEGLKAAMRVIIGLAKSGDSEAAYQEYARLFASASFNDNRVEERRAALKFLVLAKAPAKESNAYQAACLAAHDRISELVEAVHEPADYELLGACQKALGRDAAARETFTLGLAAERARNASSDLCGNLMRRMSEL